MFEKPKHKENKGKCVLHTVGPLVHFQLIDTVTMKSSQSVEDTHGHLGEKHPPTRETSALGTLISPCPRPFIHVSPLDLVVTSSMCSVSSQGEDPFLSQVEGERSE